MSLKILIPLLMSLALALILTDVPDTLDARLYYSGLEAQEYLGSLSESARHLYVWHELIDLFFITTYSLIFWRLAQLTFPNRPRLRFLAFVPGLFDYLETITIILILRNSIGLGTTSWLGALTLLKWSLGTLLALFLLLRFFWSQKKIQPKLD